MSAIIPESELIINARGGIYHLDVRPEELAPIVITVGDPGRVKEVSKYFDKIEVQREHREFITHTGTLGNKRISVVSTGIGPDNIDIVLNELDALANIDFRKRVIKPELTSLQIFRIGTSGSLQPWIPVDDFVAATHGLGLDNLLNYYCYENNEEERELLKQFTDHTQLNGRFSRPYIAQAGTSLLKYFVEGYHQGITVTCPGFYGPQGRVLRLGLSYPNLINQLTGFNYGNYRITNFEMETSALYGLGRLLGHQCLSLNVIVANRILKQFSGNYVTSIDRLIRTTLGIIIGM